MASVTDLQTRQASISTRLREIDADADGAPFTDSQRDEWNALNEEFEANRKQIEELEARAKRLAELVDRDSVETEQRMVTQRGGRNRKRVPDDPTDMQAYRSLAGSIDELHNSYKEGALQIIERMDTPVPGTDKEGTQGHLERLLKVVDHPEERALARRVITTSSPAYERAFGKKLAGQHLSSEEERALSLTVGAGGYAVPYSLDPTVILVSNGQVNPVRSFARVETITGTTWQGISSTGITAAYAAEATEASDNAPTLVQPSATVEKAQAFVPYSIEIGQDWGGLVAEVGMLLADAKDDLESSSFLTGLGHSSNAPEGLLVGATAVVTSATTAVFAVADLYSLENALGPRFRSRGRFVGNKAAYQKIRQFDTGGGGSLWVQLAYDEPATLLGYPAHEWSDYSSAVTTSASTILTFGDFSKFLIVDRVGMDVEVIPHLFATANNRPSGQRGLYCYWRNTSEVLTPGLQANSAFVSLKLL